MTKVEILREQLLEAVRDKNAKMSDFRPICSELFEALGGESKLRELKKACLKERAKRLDADVEKLIELEKQVDELERYKLWK